MRLSKNRVISVLVILVFVLLVTNFSILKEESNIVVLQKPSFAEKELDRFLSEQAVHKKSLQKLREDIVEYIDLYPEYHISVYYEHLETGAWIGVDEENQFAFGSLTKVPLMVAMLKQVEEGKISLTTKVKVQDDDRDTYSGPLGFSIGEVELTVGDLLNYSGGYSDNTATNVIYRLVGLEGYVDAMLGMDMRYGLGDNANVTSPKSYGHIFQSLHFSKFLTKQSSQLILSILSNSVYTTEIPGGVPEGITVAHKIAILDTIEEHHDCGIVYAEDPYVLCIMTRGFDQLPSKKVFSDISRIVYKGTA